MLSFFAKKPNLLHNFIVVLRLSFLLKWPPTALIGSQWFLNLLSNQACASRLAKAWFDRRFNNHWPRMQICSEC